MSDELLKPLLPLPELPKPPLKYRLNNISAYSVPLSYDIDPDLVASRLRNLTAPTEQLEVTLLGSWVPFRARKIKTEHYLVPSTNTRDKGARRRSIGLAIVTAPDGGLVIDVDYYINDSGVLKIDGAIPVRPGETLLNHYLLYCTGIKLPAEAVSRASSPFFREFIPRLTRENVFKEQGDYSHYKYTIPRWHSVERYMTELFDYAWMDGHSVYGG